jgi:hypothetical protein
MVAQVELVEVMAAQARMAVRAAQTLIRVPTVAAVTAATEVQERLVQAAVEEAAAGAAVPVLGHLLLLDGLLLLLIPLIATVVETEGKAATDGMAAEGMEETEALAAEVVEEEAGEVEVVVEEEAAAEVEEEEEVVVVVVDGKQ